jgi:hypothetical protein
MKWKYLFIFFSMFILFQEISKLAFDICFCPFSIERLRDEIEI